MRNLVLLKLGGSVITSKDKPLTHNAEAIDAISRTLAQLKLPMIVVHGGGSFGHYLSVQYDMHTKPAAYDPHGVAIVHESMIALNQIIVKSMIKAGMNPYGLPPTVLMLAYNPISLQIAKMPALIRSGLVPVTFGDVVHVKNRKYSILSGDVLMTILAIALKPSHVIFATNVDGVFRDIEARELLTEITTGRESIKYAEGQVADVTGGMRRKLTEAFKIASHGMEVVMVNGLQPERIGQAVKGTLQVGTVIRKWSRNKAARRTR